MTAREIVPGPGCYPQMRAETYHSDPAPRASLSATLAKEMLYASPLHAWVKSPRLNAMFEPTHREAFDIGHACHAMLTGVDMGKVVAIDAPDWRTKDAKAARDAAYAEGKVPLLAEQYERTIGMMEAARFQLRRNKCGDVFEIGRCEQSYFAEIDDVWCRARADCIIPPGDAPDTKKGVVVDYKTTAERANPASWDRTLANLGYDVQAAHYLETIRAIEGGDWIFRLVVQEKSDPFALVVMELSEEWLHIGARKVERARDLWRSCLEEGNWPGYPAEVCVLEPPVYHARSHYEREEMEAEHRQRYGTDVIERAMAWDAPQEPVA